MRWSQISRHDRQYHADAATSAKNQKTRGPIRSVMGVPSMPSLSARSHRDTAGHTRRRSRRSDAGRRGFPVQARRRSVRRARPSAESFAARVWIGPNGDRISPAVGAGLANRRFGLKWIERVRDSPHYYTGRPPRAGGSLRAFNLTAPARPAYVVRFAGKRTRLGDL